MKKIISTFLCVCLLLASLTNIIMPAYASEISKGTVSGKNIVSENFVMLDNGYYLITIDESESSITTDESTTYAAVKRTVSKSYRHGIYDTNGIRFAYIDTVVEGYYYSPEQEAEITEITCKISNSTVSGLSTNVKYEGRTATVYIFLNGLPIGSFGYKISLSGSITQT